MAPLYTAAAATATTAGVRIVLGTRYAGRRGDTFHLLGRDGPTAARARFVVGADGARSSVARDLGLDRNHHLLVGAEEVFELAGPEEPPTFHCVLDPSLAARLCRRRTAHPAAWYAARGPGLRPRTPTVAQAAFTLLRTPIGRAAAGRVLFGDKSFPTPAR